MMYLLEMELISKGKLKLANINGYLVLGLNEFDIKFKFKQFHSFYK